MVCRVAVAHNGCRAVGCSHSEVRRRRWVHDPRSYSVRSGVLNVGQEWVDLIVERWNSIAAGEDPQLEGQVPDMLPTESSSPTKLRKSSRALDLPYLEQLHTRNEYLIGSQRPLRATLMRRTGGTKAERWSFLQQSRQEALNILAHVWRPTATDTPAV